MNAHHSLLAISILAAAATAQARLVEPVAEHLPSIGDGPLGLVDAADFDGDGRDDVALLEDRRPSFLWAAPDGSLGGRQVVDTRAWGNALAAAVDDVDGDGDQDLVVLQTNGDLVIKNLGARRFGVVDNAIDPTARGALSVHLFDADGDGDSDLLLTGGSIAPRLQLNDGSGRFTLGPSGALPSFNFNVLDHGDVDGDGSLDLLAGVHGTQPPRHLMLLLNSGSGVFTNLTSGRLPIDLEFTSDGVLADLDGDGDLDAYVGKDRSTGQPGQDLLLLNDGRGFFSDATAGLPVRPRGTSRVAAADVDGDRDVDIVVTTSIHGSEWFRNDGSARFVAERLPQTGGRLDAAVGLDVDGSGGATDLFVAGHGPGNSALLLNDGAGGLRNGAAAYLATPPRDTHGVGLVDVDGDSDLDLLISTESRGSNGALELLLFVNDGSGRMEPDPTRLPPLERVRAREFLRLDVDRNGATDVLAVGIGPRLLVQDGMGRFVDETSSRLPDLSSELFDRGHVGDFDGDGDEDVLLTGSDTWLLLDRGDGHFVDGRSRLPRLFWSLTDSAIGDVDRDGDLDAIVVASSGPPADLWLNDGTGTFVTAPISQFAPPAGLRSVALTDVDGDGDLDLMGADSSELWLMRNDSGALTVPTSVGVGTRVNLRIHPADFDRDGDPDLLLQHHEEPAQLFWNDGSGGFADGRADYRVRGDEWVTSIAVGDLDGDADPDVVIGSNFTDRLALTYGDGQIAAPRIPRRGQVWPLRIERSPGLSPTFSIAMPLIAPASGRTPIPGAGMLWLDPAGMVQLDPVFAMPGTRIEVPIHVPNVAALAGSGFFVQALFVSPLAQLRLSNLLHQRIH